MAAKVEAQGTIATPSALAFVKVLETLSIVLVQDAIVLADILPKNPLHARLLADAEFRCAHVSFGGAACCALLLCSSSVSHQCMASVPLQLPSLASIAYHGPVQR